MHADPHPVLSSGSSSGAALGAAAHGRGLPSFTFQLNLSRVRHTQNTLHNLNTPLTQATQPRRAPPIPYKALKLS